MWRLDLFRCEQTEDLHTAIRGSDLDQVFACLFFFGGFFCPFSFALALALALALFAYGRLDCVCVCGGECYECACIHTYIHAHTQSVTHSRLTKKTMKKVALTTHLCVCFAFLVNLKICLN